MLTVHSLNKSFDLKILFEEVTFSLSPGERIGLVGPNGCGKTTLMRILAGLEPASGGQVSYAGKTRIGYLAQGLELDLSEPVGAVIGRTAGDIHELEDQLAAAAEALALHPQDPGIEARFEDLLHRVENAETGRAARIMAGMGLDFVDNDLPVRALSGGQKTRLALGLVLLSDPQVLLLDEPTNHLDIPMLEWLEDWLRRSECAVLIISHDRTFLDGTVTGILEMDPLKQRVNYYAGNYSDYVTQRQAEIEHQWSAYHDQQETVRQMRADIERVKSQAAYTERQTRSARIGGHEMKGKGVKDHLRGVAVKVARKAKARETKLNRYIDADERVEKPRENAQIQINFGNTPHLGKSVLQTDHLAVGYQQEQALLSGLNLDIRSGQRIVITGPNGGGKTTLMRTLVGELAPLGGQLQLSTTARLGYMAQDQDSLNPDWNALETIQPHFPNQTAARKFLARFLFTADEPLKQNCQLSFGQRARLILALLVAQECNLLLLDEPINHLDISSRAQFEQALSQFEGAVVVIVHDRYFIERFAEEVWWIKTGNCWCLTL